MSKITGIGGVFLKTNHDPKTLLHWYRDQLGLDVTEYGINFLCPNQLTLVTFQQGEGEAVLNFTVDCIEDYVDKLRKNGVVIHQEIQDQAIGKFAQIKDPFENIVELWEPKHEAYVDMVDEEIKAYKSK